DGGPSCEKALAFLTSTDAFKDIDLHLVIVSEDSGKEEKALNALHSAETQLRDAGYLPKCHMLHGVPEEKIAEYVASEDINLLIMGAYGHGRIRQLFIGSTTTEMIRSCRVPVMLFR